MRNLLLLAVPGAVAVTLGLSAAAFGQTVVGSQTIDGTDLALVQAHCQALMDDPDHAGDAEGAANADAAAGATAQPGGEGGQAVEGAAGASTSGSVAAPGVAAGNEAVANAAGSQPAGGDAAAGAEVSGVNLDIITLADCEAADLVEAKPQ